MPVPATYRQSADYKARRRCIEVRLQVGGLLLAELRKAEVHNLNQPVPPEHDVLRLDVSMNHTRGVRSPSAEATCIPMSRTPYNLKAPCLMCCLTSPLLHTP